MQATIYSSGEPNPWTVVVSIGFKRDIVISSGNKDSDWNLIVPEKSIGDLKTALLRHGAAPPGLGSYAEDCISMLSEIFGGRQKNPFEEIEELLKKGNVDYRDQTWL